MKQIIRENKAFILPMVVLLLCTLPFLFLYDKGAFSLWLNARHNTTADVCFRYITWLGDGWTITIFCVVLLFISFRKAFMVSIVSIFSALCISVIKNLVQEPRPSMYFRDMPMHYIEGLQLYHGMSFPSGHTAGACTFFFILAILSKKKSWKFLWLLPPLLVAVSRVYLLQHFLIDVWAGLLFGMIFTILLAPALMRFAEKRIPEGRSLRSIFRKEALNK
ncbi:MAG: phosphatase PAP2 family protein [Chitinophagales bacterium]